MTIKEAFENVKLARTELQVIETGVVAARLKLDDAVAALQSAVEDDAAK